MEKFWTFVQDMTFWNWISLIAFLFFPLSALNAFFSLRSRYLDWRGTKSKKEFERRIVQLEKKLSQVEEFQNNPTKLFIYALDNALGILVFFLTGLLMFMLMFGLNSSLIGSLIFPNVAFLLAILFMFVAFLLAIKLSNLVHNVYDPTRLPGEILKFLHNGAKKGLPLERGSKLLSVLEKDKISNSVDVGGS